MINDRLGVCELIDGDLEFAGSQFVFTFIFIDAPDADVGFGLKAVGFANGSIERADRFVGLSGIAIDAAFNGRSFRIDRAGYTRSVNLS